MSVLIELQNWYQSQCDGNWEHQFGIEIGNLDNPGWYVKIDLIDTKLTSKTFKGIKINNSEDDWIFCKIEDEKFVGYSDVRKLEMILQTFLEWSKE